MKFEDIEVGMTVKVISSTYDPTDSTRELIGKEAKVVKKTNNSIVSLYCKDLGYRRDFYPSDLEPVQEFQQYITGDDIKDAPTGLYRVHLDMGGIRLVSISRFNRETGKVNYTDTGTWEYLEHLNLCKLEPLYLDEPIKAKPVPIVGKWYWVKLAKDSEYTPMKCSEFEGDLLFSHAFSLSATYAWVEEPMEMPQ